MQKGKYVMRCTITGLLMLISCWVFGGEYQARTVDNKYIDKPIKTITGEEHPFEGYVSRTADLVEAKLNNAVLSRAALWYNKLDGINLDGSDLRFANLRGCELKDAKLNNANLIGVRLDDANLLSAELRGANLSVAHLAGADFSHADLTEAKLNNIQDMKDSSFNRAKINNADFSESNISGANFRYVEGWKSADWKGAYFYRRDPPRWPKGFPSPKKLGIVEKDL